MVVGKRSVEGVGIDDSWQYFHERPAAQDEGETVDATDPEPAGEVRTENVPFPPKTADERRPDVDEDRQTSLDEWRWSA